MRATDTVLARPVAIKLLRPGIGDDVRMRLRKEAQLMAQLRHQNVANVYTIGDWEDTSYVVMEYIEGDDLSQRIASLHPSIIPRMEGLRIVDAISRGVQAIHEAGLVHGDLKPGNVMLEKGTNRVVVTDFGAARVADAASGSPRGTPAPPAAHSAGRE